MIESLLTYANGSTDRLYYICEVSRELSIETFNSEL